MPSLYGSKRRSGVVQEVLLRDYEGGVAVAIVRIKYDCGAAQNFASCVLTPKLAEQYLQDLCDLFEVGTVQEITDQPVYTLFGWGTYQDAIVGIENARTGVRFILSNWAKEEGLPSQTAIELQREQLLNDLYRVNAQVVAIARRLAQLQDGYTEWTTEPLIPPGKEVPDGT